MIARLRPILTSLLIALSCGTVAPVLAADDGERNREPRESSRRIDVSRDSFETRRSDSRRNDGRRNDSRAQPQPQRSYPQPGFEGPRSYDQFGYPSSRSYPQPGYSNPIQPGQFRHDPYSRESARDPSRFERTRDYRAGDDRYRDDARQENRERGYERRDSGYDSRPLRPVNDVIRQVEGSYGGKVVGVQQAGNDYRVRVLQRDGRVRTVTVPAR